MLKLRRHLIIIFLLLLLFSSPALIYAFGSGAIITTVAGDGNQCIPSTNSCGDNGPATTAQLKAPAGITVDKMGDLYIADQSTHRIRKVSFPTGIIITVAGDGNQCNPTTALCGDNGPAIAAQLRVPMGVAVGEAGNLYIADRLTNRIRKVISATGIITTVAGDGNQCNPTTALCGDNGPATAAQLFYPSDVTVDNFGNFYIAELANHRIRKVISSTGIITTVAGTGTAGAGGDNGPATAA